MKENTERFFENLPEEPGVYLMRGVRRKLLYIGKAANLRKRVASYFTRPHAPRIEKLVSSVKSVDYEKTDTALEALILEAKLIKKHRPPYNVKEKDDKSFLYVELAKQEFPRVFLVRGRDGASGIRFGPFTSASSARQALKIIRRIFPFSVHPPDKVGAYKKPCFDYEIGLCPGTCIGAISKREYARHIRNIKLFFQGRKRRLISLLEKEMREASGKLEFERAEKLKRQIFALQHIQDVALISDENVAKSLRGKEGFRIEGYDISNISGTSAVGSMVVFMDGKPEKRDYRKFRIRTIQESNDVGMMKEMLERRFRRAPPAGGWPLPALVLVDGGKGQVNAAQAVLDECGMKIPVVGIAKGPTRKKTDVVGKMPEGVELRTLVRVRDEAHRFAVKYHRELRGRRFVK